jgi:hypothetical protein
LHFDQIPEKLNFWREKAENDGTNRTAFIQHNSHILFPMAHEIDIRYISPLLRPTIACFKPDKVDIWSGHAHNI